MHRQIVKELISESYTHNELDQQKVMRISSILNRSDLKQYIRALKEQEKKSTVILTIPEGMEDIELRSLKSVFPNKKYAIEQDPHLILGVKVTDNDNVYEFTLRNTLEKMVEYIDQKYD